MEQLLNAYGKAGITGFLVIVFAYIVVFHVVPHCKERDNKNQEFKRKVQDRIQEREDGILKEVAGLIRQNVSESQKLAERVDVLTEIIRQEYRQKRGAR